ncbi:MAG: restriction endonuclease subunit S, partial [Sphaerospermopsis kisseleviana]
DSGVEWLGDIPEHWECMTLKRHLLPKVGAIKTGPFGSQLLSSEMNDTEVKVYNQRNVLDQDFVGGTNYISEIKYQELKSFEVFPGDFLITTRGTIGKCAITPADCPKGILHPCLMRLQLNPKSLLDHFLMYLLQDGEVILEQLKIKSNATTIDVIYFDSLKSVFIPTPPLEEQKKIARFLDYKTKQIDDLIAKKETLIEKLDEKRTSLISHAVTKGLDVNVQMKDSGIEWLGDIPKHWEVKRLKFLVTKIGSGKTPKGGSEVYINSGIMLIRSQNVYDDGLRLDDVVYIDDDIDNIQANSRVFPNDILLNITGASIGRTSLIPPNVGKANVNQHVCIFRPKLKEIFPQYLHLLFCSQQGKEQIFSCENGISREGL